MSRIDLHTHSSFSDGSEAPEKLIDLARAVGCSTIALTDHDTLEGLPRAMAAGRRAGVRVIPGVELSCHGAGGSVHLLGYFVDIQNESILQHLSQQRAQRKERNLLLAERLQELGFDIDIREVEAHAANQSVGRPHFAAVLMAKGHVATIAEAFDRYLSDTGTAYVERKAIDISEAIEWIHAAGGAAVWAHPVWKNRSTDFTARLEKLCAAGLDGIEAWYAMYDQLQRRELSDIAKRFDLVATGGSDFHGTYKPHLEIGKGTGDLYVPEKVVDDLEDRAASHR